MRVTSVELHPANSSDVCVLSFRDPRRQNPYNVKAIDGLDADEIVPRYYGGLGSSKLYNLLIEKRDVVIRVELNPRFGQYETYSDLRDALYKMIASSRTGRIQLQFKNGIEVVAAISGFISKFEAPNFEKTQEIRLTVKCDEPMLKALTPIVVDVAGLDPVLTVIQDATSTAPHGFKFEVAFTAFSASFNIKDPNDSNWAFEIVPAGGFVPNDILLFGSESNNKYLYYLRETE